MRSRFYDINFVVYNFILKNIAGSFVFIILYFLIFLFSLDSVISQLKDEHYTMIAPEDMLEGRVFCVDSHCSDMLVFPPDSRDFILEHGLLHNRHIVMQVGENLIK